MVVTQIFFIFTLNLREDEPILTHIFEMGGWNLKIEGDGPDGSDDFPSKNAPFPRDTFIFRGGVALPFFSREHLQGVSLLGGTFGNFWRERWAAKSLWGNSLQGNCCWFFG